MYDCKFAKDCFINDYLFELESYFEIYGFDIFLVFSCLVNEPLALDFAAMEDFSKSKTNGDSKNVLGQH